jgi:hypothetical protein
MLSTAQKNDIDLKVFKITRICKKYERMEGIALPAEKNIYDMKTAMLREIKEVIKHGK